MIELQSRRREPNIPTLWWSGSESSARMILEECTREFGVGYAPIYLEKEGVIVVTDYSRNHSQAYPGYYIVMDPLHGLRALSKEDFKREFKAEHYG